MEPHVFPWPDPLPKGAVLIGPGSVSGETASRSLEIQHFEDPAVALQWVQGLSAPSDFARLVFLHQDSFAGNAGADQLVHWLEDLASTQGSFLPVLLHGNLPSPQLVRFFRAGLFDALSLPVSRSHWINMLIRAEKRLEIRKQSRLLLEESGETQSLLREMRRELGGQAARNAGELLKAQESLESANRQLTEAMGELSLLYKFGRELSQASNWDGVLRDILKNLADYVQAGGAALILRSAPGGSYSPRKTYRWNESAWDKVLVNLQDQVDDAVAESITAPGVFRVNTDDLDSGEPGSGRGRRIIALPLEFQEIRLGYLLLLFATPEARDLVSQKNLPFLQTVQVVLSEEIAGAQMLDRIRDIGAFNSRVLETVRSAIWVLDEEGHTVYCNRSGQEMLTGQESRIAVPDEFTFQIGRGRHQGTLEHYGELPELMLDARLSVDDISGLLLPQMRKKAAQDFRGEGRVLRSDGEGIPVQIQSALMPGRGPGSQWLVLVAEDLRETRKLEAERLRSEQLESLVEMSATLAHEIRNPLMGLSAQAELLADQLPENDPKSRYIQVITGEVDRINDTITRMLNYVRPYAPQRDEVDLQDICRDVKDLVEPRTRNKLVDMELHIQDSHSWSAILDGGQLKQVLLNLVINAIDAVGNGGKVELHLGRAEKLEIQDRDMGTRKVASGFKIEVKDNGCGIDAADLSKIFRPFFTTKNSGTGLGLSICQKIVAAHDGEIQATRENEMTIFRVLLPCFQQNSAPLKSQQEEA